MKLAIVMAGLAVALVIQGPVYASTSPLSGHARLAGAELGFASAWRPGEPMRFEQHGGHGGHGGGGGGGGARGRATASRGPSNPGTGGQAVARTTNRPVFSRFRRPVFFSPFAFNPFGFGFWGYDPFWWGYWGYPWAWGYPYGGYGYGYGDGYYGGDASMRLDVKPSSADVYVDGYFVGQVRDFSGAFHHLDVEPGAHKIEVRATGYQTLAIDVNLMGGRTVSYHGELKPGAGDNKHP